MAVSPHEVGRGKTSEKARTVTEIQMERSGPVCESVEEASTSKTTMARAARPDAVSPPPKLDT